MGAMFHRLALLAATQHRRPSVASIVGAANLAELWDARDVSASVVSGRVPSWVGRVRGLSLLPASAAQQPAFTPANGKVGGKPTVDLSIASNRSVKTYGNATPLAYAGSRPGLYVIGRLRGVQAFTGGGLVVSAGRAGRDPELNVRHDTSGDVSYNSASFYAPTSGAQTVNGTSDADTRSHLLGLRLDAAGLTYVRDGAIVGTNPAALLQSPLAFDLTQFALGNGIEALGNLWPSDFSCAVAFVTHNPLTLAQLQALEALRRADYATPPLPAFPVPARATAFWDCRLGIGLGAPGRVQTWTDQIGGRVITATSASARPIYAAELQAGGSELFAVQANVPNARSVGTVALSPPLARTGQRASICLVSRQRLKVPTGYQIHVHADSAPADPRAGLQLTSRSDGAGNEYWYLHKNNNNAWADTITTDTQDLATHVWEYLDNAVNERRAQDGVTLETLATGAAVNALAADQVQLGLGAGPNGSTGHANASILAYVHMDSEPTGAERAAMLDWAKEVGKVPYAPPLPAATVELWHAELGFKGDNANGRVGGRVLTPRNSAVIAYSQPGFGNGRMAFSASIAGPKVWRGGSLAPLAPANAPPWVMLVLRVRTIPAPGFTTRQVFSLGDAGYRINVGFSTPGLWTLQTSFGGLVTTIGTVATDLEVHRLKVWWDGSVMRLSVDDAIVCAHAPLGSMPALTAAGIGTLANIQDGWEADTDLYMGLVSASNPAPAEESALDDYARAYFGSN